MATKDNNQNSELETNELLSEENAQNADDLNDDKNDDLNQNTDETDETDEDGTQEQDSDNEDNEQENEEKDNDEKDESVNDGIDDLLPREDFKIERGDTEQSGGDIDDLLPKDKFQVPKPKKQNEKHNNETKAKDKSDIKEELKKALNENTSWLEQIKITLLATERLCLSFEKLERHYNEDMKAHNILKDESKELVGEAKKSFDLITQKLKELDNSFQSYNAFLKQTYENFNETLSENEEYFANIKKNLNELCEETNAKSAEVLLFRQNILTAIERLDEVIKSAEELENTMDNGVRK